MGFDQHVRCSLGELAAWARHAGLLLPFPLVATVGVEARSGSAVAVPHVLTSVLARLGAVVYAVRVPVGGPEQRFVGLQGADGSCVLLCVDGAQVRIAPVARDRLVAVVVDEVVSRLPRWSDDRISGVSAGGREVEVPLLSLAVVDAAIDRDGAAIDRVGLLAGVGIDGDVVRPWLDGSRAVATGVLGALAATHDTGSLSRHSRRSVSWREYRGGGLLAEQLPSRTRRPAMVRLGPVTPLTLTRAGVDQFGSAVRQQPVRAVEGAR